MTFYNTIDETAEELAESQAKAQTQGEKILDCFYSCDEPLSPSMVLARSGLNCPITSIRRAMTNLSNEGQLEKTNDYVKGIYGKREHLWTLPTVREQSESYTQPSLGIT
jgi:hypothetical protein